MDRLVIFCKSTSTTLLLGSVYRVSGTKIKQERDLEYCSAFDARGGCIHIWKERNQRLFKKNRRSAQMVAREIVEEIRLKLVAIKTKPSARVLEVSNVRSIVKW